MLPRNDAGCVVHLHSLYSDGTGTVPEIAAAADRAGADVVLLTDHDSLEARRRGEEGWHGPVLVCVGSEVSPSQENHYLAFGLEEEVDHTGLDAEGILRAVADAGGFGFAAHPFSKGSERFRRAQGMPWRALDSPALAGIELWSWVTDTAESLGGLADAARFVIAPERVVDHPPPANLEAWDAMCRERRVVAIGGLDAHQFGRRIAGRVPLRLMGYHRSFRHLRTRVLLDEPFTGDGDHDRDLVYAALRTGHCYLAMDSLAPARGFALWADGEDGEVQMGEETEFANQVVHARVPRPAAMKLVHNGQTVQEQDGTTLDHPATAPGTYRIEARLPKHGRERTWIVSNPVYLR